MSALGADRCVAETLTDIDALEALAPEWWALWRRCPEATPFQSPAWLIPWWRHFHPGALRCAVVRHGGRLAGLAPLYLEDGQWGRRLLPLGISLSDFSDVLLDFAVPEASHELLRHLAGRADWDSWSMEELAPGAAALRLSEPGGWRDDRHPQSACPAVDLSGRVDDDGLPLEIPPKRRQNVRRAVRAAGASGLSVETMTDADAFLDHLAALHAKRWQSRGEAGVLADVTVRSFHREALPGLLSAGLARLTVARIGGVVAAALYGLRHGPLAAIYLSGFSPAFERESPLTVLIGDALRDAAASGATRFSFLRGQEHYKYLWGATDRWNVRRTLTRPAR